MGYSLAPNLHCAILGDRAVILDVGRDSYRLLGPPAADALQSAGGPQEAADVLARLHALNIIVPGPGGIPLPGAEAPVRSAVEMTSRETLKLGVTTVALALIRSMASLRCRGLAASLRQSNSAPCTSPQCDDEVIAVAQAYERQRARIPLHQICLADSIALRRILRARKLGASLIIGVRLDPFAAHCWLQAGDIVLNDSCDHVSSFTPILVQ